MLFFGVFLRESARTAAKNRTTLKVTILLVMCCSLASTVSDSENDDDAFC